MPSSDDSRPVKLLSAAPTTTDGSAIGTGGTAPSTAPGTGTALAGSAIATRGEATGSKDRSRGTGRRRALSAPAHLSVGAVEGDHMAVARLLGREPAGCFCVVLRRLDGTPAVIENEPWLADGTPMPTRYWLVDPELRVAVSRLESAGGVRRAEAAVAVEALDGAHARYAAERLQIVQRYLSSSPAPGPRPCGGVGGTRRGVKCLHAHLAWNLAGGEDPVGAWAAAELAVDRGDFVVCSRHEELVT